MSWGALEPDDWAIIAFCAFTWVVMLLDWSRELRRYRRANPRPYTLRSGLSRRTYRGAHRG